MMRIASVLLLAAVAGGCAAAQAKVPAERPALDVPAAPPRVIEKTVQETAPPEPVPELPPQPVTPPKPRPQAPVRETAKVEPKPETPVDTPVVVASAPAPVPPLLRTPQTADSAGAARQVSELLDRANKALGSINYQRLSKDRRDQYEQVKLMITECEQAVKAANFEKALNLADKAERLANALQTR
ncbi:MAG: hypothetical protein QOD74_2934 [Variibacter sp.]|jgi:outer membrane biosynthesis protein TonB|nr:hypothetical protein [Variibacter sp.]